MFEQIPDSRRSGSKAFEYLGEGAAGAETLREKLPWHTGRDKEGRVMGQIAGTGPSWPLSVAFLTSAPCPPVGGPEAPPSPLPPPQEVVRVCHRLEETTSPEARCQASPDSFLSEINKPSGPRIFLCELQAYQGAIRTSTKSRATFCYTFLSACLSSHYTGCSSKWENVIYLSIPGSLEIFHSFFG